MMDDTKKILNRERRIEAEKRRQKAESARRLRLSRPKQSRASGCRARRAVRMAAGIRASQRPEVGCSIRIHQNSKIFRSRVNYALGKGDAKIIDSNCSYDRLTMLHEMLEASKIRKDIKNPVAHFSISISPTAGRKDDAFWQSVVDEVRVQLDIPESHPFIVVRHFDKKHDHVHFIFSRVSRDGQVHDQTDIRWRASAAAQVVEQKFGLPLTPVKSHAEGKKYPPKNEIEAALRTGEPSARLKLQGLLDAAMLNCESFDMYLDRVEAVGIEVIPVLQKNGAVLTGLSYRLNGEFMKSSDLGKKYGALGLKKLGISYEIRHFERINSLLKREAARKSGSPDQANTNGEIPEHRFDGRSVAAAGRGDGDADGGVGSSNIGIDRSHGEGSTTSRPAGNDEQQAKTDRLAGDSLDDFESAADRLLSLSAGRTAGTDGLPEARHQNHIQHPASDRTTRAVAAQVAAFAGVDEFDIGVLNETTGKMQNRIVARADIGKHVGWLKRQNVLGHHVYCRPHGDEHPYILLDDLNQKKLETLNADGFEPALVVETSPENFQAWIRFPSDDLNHETRLELSRSLARKYGGDPGAVKANQYGRLAGYTNVKQKHSKNGRFPFSLLKSSGGKIAPHALDFLDEVRADLKKRQTAEEKTRRLEVLRTHKLTIVDRTPSDAFKNAFAELVARYGNNLDMSRADFMIAKSMVNSGYSNDQITEAMRENSPDLAGRKGDYADSYIKRTLDAAHKKHVEELAENEYLNTQYQQERSQNADFSAH